MSPAPVEVFIVQNQECSLPLPAAAVSGASGRQAAREGSYRFLRTFAARRKRSWVAALPALLLACQGAWAQSGVFSTPQPVGVVSGAQNVTVTARAAGTVATVEVLTMGAPNLDFTGVPGSSTCLSATLTVTQTCTESVTFTPSAPGVRMGAVVLLDINDDVLGTAYLSGIGSGGLGVLAPGNMITVAGIYKTYKSTGNGIPATQANLDQPSSITLDGEGNLYIADSAHNQIRMVCGGGAIATIAGTTCTTSGIISAIAGTGDAGYTGDGGAASEATLSGPSGVALDGAGNLYIADTNNNVIRMVSATTGIITTVVGSIPGNPGYAGDGQLATQAELNSPQGVTLDGSGNLYIADTGNQRIRMVSAATGDIDTVAGDGDPSGNGNGKGTYTGDGGLATTAGLSLPYAVAFDTFGNMYIPDSANNVIREVSAVAGLITSASTIRTVVGFYPGTAGYSGDGGPATKALLYAPESVAVDPAGNLYIADTQNASIRKVNALTQEIATLITNQAGNNVAPGAPAGTTPSGALIYAPVGLFLDGSGNLYFADYFYMLAEEVQSNLAYLNFTSQLVQAGTESTAQNQTVENDGNASLDLTTFTPTNAVVTANTTCSLTTALPADTPCMMNLEFAPSLTTVFGTGVASEPLDGSVVIYGNTVNYPLNIVNFPLDIVLVGAATPVDATTLTLTSSSAEISPGVYDSNYGAAVTFTATVTTGAGQGTPTGTVTFVDTPASTGVPVTLKANVPLNGSGVAIYTTAAPLTVGSHKISATYTPSSGSNYLASPSGTLIQNVYEPTATALAVLPASPSTLGASVTFTATVTAPDGGGVSVGSLAGYNPTVTFTDGATILCNAVPVALIGTAYQAACATAALPQGTNTILAAYSGDAAAYVAGSNSSPLTQDVQAASTVTLGSAPNPSIYGDQVTFTITVPTYPGGTAPATGKVNIYLAGQTAPLNGTTPLTLTTVAGTSQVSFLYASLPVSTLANPDNLRANYLGDTNYSAGTSNTVPQVVNQATTQTAVTAHPNPGIAGAPVAITATVTVTQGVSTPGGSVTITDSVSGGAPVSLGSPALGTGGTATVDPMLAPGTHTIIATYSGDTDDAGSQSILVLTVNQAVTTTTLSTSGSPALVLSPVTFTAKVASIGGGVPAGSVAFTATPAGGATFTLPCAGTLAAGTATCTTSTLAVGSYTITATYSGDTNDAASSGTLQQQVGTIPTLTGLGSAMTQPPNPQQVILVATVVNDPTVAGDPTPTGTVVFSSVNGSTLTQIGSATLDLTGVATLIPASLPPGTFTVVAAYLGDADHSPSTSTPMTISNPASDFTLAVTPDNPSVKTTQNVTVNVALASVDGFTDTIGLGCASLPAGVNCHFSTPTITLPANGTENVALTIDTNNPLGGGTSARNARPGGSSVSLAGFFLPLGILFGCVFWRLRRRYARWMTLALVMLLGGVAMAVNGCGGFSQSSAAPGTYTIQVTGTGANSNVMRYENLKLTITQ